MENCEKIDVMIEKEDELNKEVFVNRENSRECRKFNKYRWDLDLLKNFVWNIRPIIVIIVV